MLAMTFIGNLVYVGIALVGGLHVVSGAIQLGGVQPDGNGAARYVADRRDHPGQRRPWSADGFHWRGPGATRATYVDRVVKSLPEGYDTVLDDEGSNVSAGEKQLLTIGRVFRAQPSAS